MYQTHWKLQASPFGNDVMAKDDADAPGFREALARLQYLLDQRGHVGLLLGPTGTGKTTLLRRFCEQSRRNGWATAVIGGRGSNERTALNELCRAWQLPRLPTGSDVQIWEMLTDRLTELRYEQTSCLIAFDDADHTSPAVRQLLARLLHLAGAAGTQLTLLFSCTTESAENIGRDWLDQVDLRIDLNPWSEEETAEYVALRLFRSGSAEPIFTDEAITALYELSGGIPRKVEQLAQLALLAGAGQQLTEIDAVTLTEAYEELGAGSL